MKEGGKNLGHQRVSEKSYAVAIRLKMIRVAAMSIIASFAKEPHELEQSWRRS
jgi:hypothetical protein